MKAIHLLAAVILGFAGSAYAADKHDHGHEHTSLHGGIVTLASIIGFISLFGIATRNGVMMISHIHHLVENDEAKDAREAVTHGAEERLVPILMTALAAGLALVPLALAAGQPGSEIQSPMAIVILFGLASSTLLNMVVVPALYLRFGAIRRVFGNGQRLRRLSTEPVTDR